MRGNLRRKNKYAAPGCEEESDRYLDGIFRLLQRFAVIKNSMPCPLERSGTSEDMSSQQQESMKVIIQSTVCLSNAWIIGIYDRYCDVFGKKIEY